MDLAQAISLATSWAQSDATPPSAQQARDAALALAVEVTRLRDMVHRARQESDLIQYNGNPALVVPYWFMRA